VDKASALADEILFDSLFEEGQIYEKLCQQKSELEQGLSYQGHVFALRRAASYIDEVNYINDSISGIGYLDFIESAVKDYESKKTKIVETLNYLRKMILSKFRFMGYCTSHEDGYSLYKNEADKIYNKLDDTNKEFSPKLSFKKNILNEGIEAPYNIVFDGQAGKYSDEGYYYSGSLKTILNPINMDYLWTAVRVKMGAYGCGCLADPSGLACFYSYRDPNIASTLETYQGVPNYLKNLKLTDEELLEYKIGAIGNEDTVLHVSAQGLDGFKSNLKGLTYETKKLRRQALLDTKQEDFAKSADIFAAALAEHAICVIGSETIIEQNKGLLKTIRKLVG
jgi:Zn-dependent M16 (insulinase) family peptidase